jgi:bacillithiol biosynthesis cysteine-adding enzyme BshC
METNCTYLTYSKTNYFSDLVIDYISSDSKLKPFYKYPVNIKGIEDAIEQRKKFPQQRNILVEELQLQYKDVAVTPSLVNSLKLLLSENTFTVTTAHQPNVFTGPLYFVYKILHAIKLSLYLKQELPAYNFVPVYFMGSEDADIDELGSINIDGVVYKWNTGQTGAVGRMKVDPQFLQLITQMQGQIGILKYGKELIEIYNKAYTKGKTIQQATLELVNHLFGEYGLVVLIPDSSGLKKMFAPVIQRELKDEFSYKAVTIAIASLEKHYKVQAGGRELNLFYLKGDKRERIEKEDGIYKIKALKLTFTEEEILNELEKYPERFSPNVILRGAFQETILPNIAFIGGGGELAYWLELKTVFETIGVPYPMLLLRNSFLVVEEKWAAKIKELGLSFSDLFLSVHELMNMVVAKQSNNRFLLNGELKNTESLYDQIALIAGAVDKTLEQHVTALKIKSLKHLLELQKKMLRAEKRKFEVEQRQLLKIKSALFPSNNLQERAENFSLMYSKLGKDFIKLLFDHSNALEQQFAIVEIVR